MGKPSRVFLLCTAASVISLGGAAKAGHNIPKKAERINSDLVRAFAQCTGVNDIHNLPLPVDACTPQVLLSPLAFGSNGSGRVSVRVRRGDVTIDIRLKNVDDPGGAFGSPGPFTGDLTADATIRISDHNCLSRNSCTVTDLPFPITVPCDNNGNCRLRTTSFMSGLAGSVEVQQVGVRDPGGNLFAVPGISIP